MTWPILENFDELTPPALPSDPTVNAGTWTSESTYSVSSPNGLIEYRVRRHHISERGRQ